MVLETTTLHVTKKFKNIGLTYPQYKSVFKLLFQNQCFCYLLGELLDNPPQEEPKRDIMEEIEEQLVDL